MQKENYHSVNNENSCQFALQINNLFNVPCMLMLNLVKIMRMPRCTFASKASIQTRRLPMQAIYILSFAIATILLPASSYAEDRYECQLRCSAEKDSRGANCTSTNQKQDQCKKKNEETTAACLKSCPPAPPSTPFDLQNSLRSK
jgi:hypothetical protein